MKHMATIIVGALAFSGSASADVLLDQPHDYRFWSRSDFGPHFINVQRGDDFKPAQSVLVESVTFWMVASWAALPNDWAFSVHRSTDDHPDFDFAPEYPWIFERTGPSSVIDLGPWSNEESALNLYEVTFADLSIFLDPTTSERGTFWFSSFGHITDRAVQTVGWGTAGYGKINGEYAWRKWMPWQYPGWAGHSLPDGSQTDFSMRIEGTVLPGPGTLAGLGLMLTMVGASRNRCRFRGRGRDRG